MRKLNSKTVAIDLDGVLAEYHGWKGEEVIGQPLPGAKEFLEWLTSMDWEPILFTTRSPDRVIAWLKENGLSSYFADKKIPVEKAEYRIAKSKPIAYVYLDDRALRFKGDFEETKKEIIQFKTYWEKEKTLKTLEPRSTSR